MRLEAFVEGEFYTRKIIHESLGGELQGYLPSCHGRIVCVCLNKKKNPRAPEVILVGLGKVVIKRAHMLTLQGGVLPVFLKEDVNWWEFKGNYKVVAFKTDKGVIEVEQIGSGRDNITGVLYFQKQAA